MKTAVRILVGLLVGWSATAWAGAAGSNGGVSIKYDAKNDYTQVQTDTLDLGSGDGVPQEGDLLLRVSYHHKGKTTGAVRPQVSLTFFYWTSTESPWPDKKIYLALDGHEVPIPRPGMLYRVHHQYQVGGTMEGRMLTALGVDLKPEEFMKLGQAKILGFGVEGKLSVVSTRNGSAILRLFNLWMGRP